MPTRADYLKLWPYGDVIGILNKVTSIETTNAHERSKYAAQKQQHF